MLMHVAIIQIQKMDLMALNFNIVLLLRFRLIRGICKIVVSFLLGVRCPTTAHLLVSRHCRSSLKQMTNKILR